LVAQCLLLLLLLGVAVMMLSVVIKLCRVLQKVPKDIVPTTTSVTPICRILVRWYPPTILMAHPCQECIHGAGGVCTSAQCGDSHRGTRPPPSSSTTSTSTSSTSYPFTSKGSLRGRKNHIQGLRP